MQWDQRLRRVKVKHLRSALTLFLEWYQRRNVEVKYYTKRDPVYISDEIGRGFLSRDRIFSVCISVVESLASVDRAGEKHRIEKAETATRDPAGPAICFFFFFSLC